MSAAHDCLSRRAILRAGAVAAVAVGAGALFVAPALAQGPTAPAAGPTEPAAEARARVFTGMPSANGWEMEKGSDIGGSVWTRPIPGSPVTAQLRLGDVAVVLVHVVRRFHYEIGTLQRGEVIGFKSPDGLTGHESNHASGTAIDIRPGWYPPGASGGFTMHELAVLRDVLADCDGVVGWGGDLAVSDEGHFQIQVGPDDPRLAGVAAKIRDWNSRPGSGAGVLYQSA